MRISEADISSIITLFQDFFGPDDHLWLFGSRVDDSQKGGDIDLYVQTHLSPEVIYDQETKFITGLWEKIGEQKIDLVLHLIDTDFYLPIYDIAQREGVLLV